MTLRESERVDESERGGRRHESSFDRGLSVGKTIMSRVSVIRLFIADLAGKQKINNFEQI